MTDETGCSRAWPRGREPNQQASRVPVTYHLSNDGCQLRGIDRLGHVELKSGCECPRAILGARVRRDRERRNRATLLGGELAHLANQRVTVLFCHPDVAD